MIHLASSKDGVPSMLRLYSSNDLFITYCRCLINSFNKGLEQLLTRCFMLPRVKPDLFIDCNKGFITSILDVGILAMHICFRASIRNNNTSSVLFTCTLLVPELSALIRLCKFNPLMGLCFGVLM